MAVGHPGRAARRARRACGRARAATHQPKKADQSRTSGRQVGRGTGGKGRERRERRASGWWSRRSERDGGRRRRRSAGKEGRERRESETERVPGSRRGVPVDARPAAGRPPVVEGGSDVMRSLIARAVLAAVCWSGQSREGVGGGRARSNDGASARETGTGKSSWVGEDGSLLPPTRRCRSTGGSKRGGGGRRRRGVGFCSFSFRAARRLSAWACRALRGRPCRRRARGVRPVRSAGAGAREEGEAGSASVGAGRSRTGEGGHARLRTGGCGPSRRSRGSGTPPRSRTTARSS